MHHQESTKQLLLFRTMKSLVVEHCFSAPIQGFALNLLNVYGLEPGTTGWAGNFQTDSAAPFH